MLVTTTNIHLGHSLWARIWWGSTPFLKDPQRIWYLSLSHFSHWMEPGWWRWLWASRFPPAASFIPHNCLAAAKSLQSCPTLCDPIDSSPPGSPVPGILQARTLEWVADSFSNAWRWKVKIESEVAQSSLTPSGPMDCSLLFPGKSTGVGCRFLLHHNCLKKQVLLFPFYRWGLKDLEGLCNLPQVTWLVSSGAGVKPRSSWNHTWLLPPHNCSSPLPGSLVKELNNVMLEKHLAPDPWEVTSRRKIRFSGPEQRSAVALKQSLSTLIGHCNHWGACKTPHTQAASQPNKIRISGGEAQILAAFSFIPADSNVKPRLRILQDSSSVANLPEEADQRI